MVLKLVIYGEKRVDGRWVLAEPWIDSRKVTDENDWMISVSGDRQPRQLCWGSRGLWRTLTGLYAGSASAPIAPPRGLPEDLSDDLKEFFAAEDFFQGEAPADGSGWLLVSELVLFDWDGKAPKDERERVRANFERLGVRVDFDDPKWMADGEEADEIAGKSWREIAGGDSFAGIERLRSYGSDADLRIVFTFGY